MPSTPPVSGSSQRRFVWLGLAIVAAIALWTIGWYLIAARIEARLPQAMQQIAGNAARADCVNAEVKGYPFRFGLFCDRLAYQKPGKALTLDSGALRSAAQFYRPGHIVSEVDGPLTLSAPGLDLRLDWRSLQASIQTTPAGLDRSSLDSRDISIDVDGAGLPQKLALGAERLTAHTRRNGPDLDFAAYGERVRSNIIDTLSVSALALEATLPGGAGLLEAPYSRLKPPFEIQLHRMTIEFDDTASLEISGQVRVGADGLISGDLQLSVRDQERIAEVATLLDPEIGENLRRFGAMLAALDSVPGDDAITLPLTIRNGNASMGLFPLGRLPAL